MIVMTAITELKQELGRVIAQYQTKEGQKFEEQLMEKSLQVLGIVNRLMESQYGEGIVITGGLAVEYYTDGNYTTQDIDLIFTDIEDNSLIRDSLTAIGFKEESFRMWSLDELSLFIEKVDTQPFNGEFGELLTIHIGNGDTVSVVNVNDMVIDRVRGVLYWNELSYIEQILSMLSKNEGLIDEGYIKVMLTQREFETYEAIKLITEGTMSLTKKVYEVSQQLDELGVHYNIIGEGDSTLLYILLDDVKIGYDLTTNKELLYDEDNQEFVKKRHRPRDIKEKELLLKYRDILSGYRIGTI